MEPKGVGAVDLKECLLLQIDPKGAKASLQVEIIEKYLELFGKNQMKEIAKKTGKHLNEVLDACDRIKRLNPKPGNSFGNREYRKYISPDVVVVKLKDYFEVLLNESQYPSIQINPYYENLLKEGAESETKKYIKEKTEQAKWVQDCIKKRNETMMALVNEIISSQIEFFEYGHGHIMPVSQKETAEKLNFHESTVSRALKGKYLQCMWGMYPLHYFFSHGIEKSGDKSQVSAEQVKAVLKEIVEEENKKKPYSDRILAEKLEERGFKISRRTVAKYREALQIGDASKRKIFI